MKKMQMLHPLLLLINFLVTISIAQSESVPTSFCGKFQIREPFLSHMTICKSQKLYFRTSLGLFPITFIDYKTKTLTISHPASSSSTRQYVSPSLLSSGFPSPQLPNSILLFNCSNNVHHMYAFTSNCTSLHVHGAASEVQEFKKTHQSCLLVDDLEKLGVDFHPKDFNCSHYRRVYRRSLDGDDVGLGTRISFDVPDHVPDICKECEKPNGNCGVGLKCICHPKECKDKVISLSGSVNPAGNILFSLLSFTMFMVLWSYY